MLITDLNSAFQSRSNPLYPPRQIHTPKDKLDSLSKPNHLNFAKLRWVKIRVRTIANQSFKAIRFYVRDWQTLYYLKKFNFDCCYVNLTTTCLGLQAYTSNKILDII